MQATAAPGDLDATFAGRGWIELSIPGRTVGIPAVVVDPDGGIVALANAFTPMDGGLASIPTIVVARWHADGAVDVGFGTAGVATINVAGHASALGSDIVGLSMAATSLRASASARRRWIRRRSLRGSSPTDRPTPLSGLAALPSTISILVRRRRTTSLPKVRLTSR